PRSLGATARQRTARHVAGTLHGADRDRRLPSAHRSGMGTARITLTPCGAPALPTGPGTAARLAAARCGTDLARPLRSSRLRDDTAPAKAPGHFHDLTGRRCAPGSVARTS